MLHVVEAETPEESKGVATSPRSKAGGGESLVVEAGRFDSRPVKLSFVTDDLTLLESHNLDT